jgi:APA family basic amino acid/polyamine antiporter
MNWKIIFRNLFRRKSIDQITHDMSYTHPNNAGSGQAGSQGSLTQVLGVWDLTAFGVAAILGAGIFSTIGNAAADGGPAVIFLFSLTAIACGFSAFCYAEFASSIPTSGSAYTYAYASFGELFAWIIGWDLLLEYAISNLAVAISWSQYFTGLLASYGIRIPSYLTLDWISASRAYEQIQPLIAHGQTLGQLVTQGISPALLKGYTAWLEAPRFFNFPFIADLPSLMIIVIITGIAYVGIEESKKTSNFLVLLKLLVILLVICVGATYVQPENWTPFAPHGAGGVLKGVSAVFFAYIGFDAISTTAEECKNPQKDLPLAMVYSLVICTVLYSLMALVLTGMVSYTKLGVGDPLAFVFGPHGVNLRWVSGVVNIGAVVALSTVLLVYQLGQPRIWMAMSRDGLLPPVFAKIHPKYKTPWVSTILTGFMVGIPSLFMNLTEVTDLTSIGTLFAFVLVCGGVLRLDPQRKADKKKFKTPYISSRYIFPILIGLILAGVSYFKPESFSEFFSLSNPALPGATAWQVISPKIPMAVYSISMVILTFFCITRSLSLIPVLGLTTCGYLMTELGWTNWIRFSLWLLIGSFIYFLYGFKNSRLHRTEAPA